MDAPQELTDIQRFYKNSTIFLTGATGFIGKLVLEKILRALPIKKVFILIRKKKEVPTEKRLQDIFNSKAFDLLKRNQPDVLQKVFILNGDCSLPMLGLSQEDQDMFIEEVDVIFHVAATVRFDDHIKKTVFTNVRCTVDLITLAQKIKNLQAFIYVGTAYSNCNRTEIKEEVYPAKIAAEKLISVCENLDEDSLNIIAPTLTKGWPNNYIFSKQVTEDYINRKARNLPICIARPSIVISTVEEPVAAFVDNLFTLAGFVLLNGLGVAKISYYKNTNLDLIPADFVVNHCIAVGWQTGESPKISKSEVPVYNISSMDNPITQDQVYTTCDYYGKQIPTKKILMYPLYFRTTCKYNYLFLRLLFHTFGAYILDISLRMQGKKETYVAGIEKMHKFQEAYEYFTIHTFFFHVENTHKMLRKMSFSDRKLFNFDVTTINWDNYFSKYVRGLRFYLLEDSIESVPEGKKHYDYLKRVFIFSAICGTIILYVLGKIILFRIVPVVFSVVLYVMRNIIR